MKVGIVTGFNVQKKAEQNKLQSTDKSVNQTVTREYNYDPAVFRNKAVSFKSVGSTKIKIATFLNNDVEPFLRINEPFIENCRKIEGTADFFFQLFRKEKFRIECK